MSSRNRIPSAIEPLLRLPPEASLTILTGTLGCSPSWLTSRFIGNLLDQNSSTSGDGQESCNCVVLVSWMRDLAFWKSDIRRTMGLDISKAIEKRQLTYVDCLNSFINQAPGDLLSRAERNITEAISTASNPDPGNHLILILEHPDVLLASASATAHQLNYLMLKLRDLVHSSIAICSADQPLLQPEASTNRPFNTPIEVEASRFLVQQAHNAHLVISVRELATGAARDISGVLRSSRSSLAYVLDEDRDSNVEEMEALYLVSRDGTVKIFQRGADAA